MTFRAPAMGTPWSGWRLFRVRGRSMAPTFRDGDIAVGRLPGHGRPPRPGDVVCVRRPGELQMIKRLGPRAADGRFRLSGDGPASAPSIDLGGVSECQIVARVVVRVPGFRFGARRRQ
ncbi:S24/S26 family peptidase [Zavarzinia compransoris]|uniref:S24 family peptidase n=1 Tax=Zavarzinia marina TaxID=2911065 RepID=UPI001F300B96|nr:S24/S26 family peptidase [Zavarzinia marina]MCF4165838.1 S24/S26 family peptidase [Zavarzinia marina]